MLKRIYDWLAVPDIPQASDVIFVLAGRECRKHFALRMLEAGWADTLLLSVARFEIRRFARFNLPLPTDLLTLAASIPPRRRHYFVTLRRKEAEVEHVPLRRFGTWSEILAFSRWLRQRDAVRTGIVISSGFHLRRVRWCCRVLIPRRTKLRFVAVPSESPSFNRDHWWRNPLPRKLVLLELVKVLLYPLIELAHVPEP